MVVPLARKWTPIKRGEGITELRTMRSAAAMCWLIPMETAIG